MHKPLLFTLLFLLASAAELRAQACNFDNLMREGKAFLDKKKPEYRRALYKFNAARTCDPNQSAVVDKEVDRLFGMIEGERDKVIVALAETERARLRADTALLLAETEKKNAFAAKETALAAEKKVTDVLDKIYFYDGRFGLAFDKGSYRYGFIDKSLTTKIVFKYGEAQPFDWTGFAKVKKDADYFFIDTLGNEYHLATELNQLSSKITALDLRRKKLAEIPDTVLKSTPLKILLLSGNQLQTLPAQIGELKSLHSLNLSGNLLQSLPAQIGELKSLQSLDLYENLLQSLPAQIGELKSLHSLGLSWNQLQTLPAQIVELKSLQSLDLRNNQLQALPVQIGELKSLQWLELSGNQFQTLPLEDFGKLPNLKKIVLANEFGINPISETIVLALRAVMPWCEIEFNPKALFEKNEAARKQSEADVIEGEARLKSKPSDNTLRKELADRYNSLGYEQLLTRQFLEAEASINRGFSLDSTNILLPTNLAPALLFQGKTAAAFREYEKWKDLPFGEQGLSFYRDAFLTDLEAFEKVGVIPDARKADVEAVRKLLGEKE
ncbi:MAG: leucine-rich repeat domain-containing protein [Saprospiraceae bacterium]